MVDIHEAQADISRLVEAIESGAEREIIISRDGKPVARLGPIEEPARKGKRLGLLEGLCPTSTQEHFDASNEEIGRLFRGEG